jgi:hypothetical protein
VTADRFGLALRSYRRRVQRLSESTTDRDRSLWEALLDYLGKEGVVSRAQVLKRFHRDDAELVKSVLHDVCESGLVFRLGAGKDAAYRAASSEELAQLGPQSDGQDELVWLVVYREAPVSLEQLKGLLPAVQSELPVCLERLLTEERVRCDDKGRYVARSVVMSPGASEGWEAGMLDHFQSVVKTLCARMRASAEDEPSPDVGGSTYSLRIWPGHPMEDEVRGALAAFRRKHTDLRKRVQAHNDQTGLPERYEEVVIYGGQCLVHKERRDHEDAHE